MRLILGREARSAKGPTPARSFGPEQLGGRYEAESARGPVTRVVFPA
jgi:hypothetical protein